MMTAQHVQHKQSRHTGRNIYMTNLFVWNLTEMQSKELKLLRKNKFMACVLFLQQVTHCRSWKQQPRGICYTREKDRWPENTKMPQPFYDANADLPAELKSRDPDTAVCVCVCFYECEFEVPLCLKVEMKIIQNKVTSIPSN